MIVTLMVVVVKMIVPDGGGCEDDSDTDGGGCEDDTERLWNLLKSVYQHHVTPSV